MNQVSVAEILELPVQERIRLVELIWESIAAVPEAVEVTPELFRRGFKSSKLMQKPVIRGSKSNCTCETARGVPPLLRLILNAVRDSS